MKINDLNESKQINELDLSPLIGSYGNAKLDSVLGNAPGAADVENRMAMDMFVKKFANNAAAAIDQAVQSGLVAKGATPTPQANPAQSQTQTQTAPTQAQTPAQTPADVRKQKQAIAAQAAQRQMADNPVAPKAAPAVAQTPAQIRQQKQASAAKAAQSQMAPVSKLPANQPAVQAQNIRQKKQAAAAQTAQSQAVPFSKVSPKPAVWSNKRNPNASPRSPIAKQQAQPAPVSKAPPGFNAQNVMKMPGMNKPATKKVPAMAESNTFDKLNNIFESIVQEAGQQSISQYLIGFFNKFMKGVDPKAVQQAMPQVQALAKEAEASYPKINAQLTKLGQLGWAVSHQQGEDEPEVPDSTPQPGTATPSAPGITSPSSTTPQPSASPQATQQQEKTVYAQVKGMLDKLDKKGKQRILTALEKSLGNAPTKSVTTPATPKVAPGRPATAPKTKAPTNEPMSIGGQKISPNDPLYAKMQQKLAGK